MTRTCAAMLMFLALSAAGCASESEPAGPALRDAWVRAAPPGQDMTAAYGRLENPTRSSWRITRWSSDSFGEVSLHRTVTANGISRMQAEPSLDLPVGAAVTLEPGGLHLMLMSPHRALRSGDIVRIRLTDESGTGWEFDVPVKAR